MFVQSQQSPLFSAASDLCLNSNPASPVVYTSMSSEEAQIKELQLSRARERAAKAANVEKDVALSSKGASMDSDIYGGSSKAGYHTELDVGGGEDEDVDMTENQPRLLDSCKSSFSIVHP